MIKTPNPKSLIEDLYLREINTSFIPKFESKNVFSRNLINHLNLECELQGHDGCVNCLEWNETGTILASGSDDLKIILWDPFRKKILNKIETKHRGNIFSVKFLPQTGGTLIASAAADRDIYVYDVNRNLNVNEIHSHQNRVKRLEVSKDTPFLFWSCGEDGLVLQHDIRCPPSSITSLLLNYSSNELTGSKISEIKCISINQVRSEFIAVGLSDPYARVYDRRMIQLRSFKNRNTQISSTTTTSSSVNSLPKCLFEYCPLDVDDQKNIPLTYYVPGHLPRRIDEYKKRMKTLSVTFVSFSPDGNELLVNLGGEQLYLYDLVTGHETEQMKSGKFSLKYDSYKEILKDEIEPSNTQNQKKKYKLPARAEELKVKANASFEEQNYVEAIEFYNQAIQLAPDSPILYGNRAATLLKRNWDGDAYAAMRDCYMALNLDPKHLKSHFRLAKCLNDLKWHHEASECINMFCQRFPDYAKSQACENLIKEIKASLNSQKLSADRSKKQRVDVQEEEDDSEWETESEDSNSQGSGPIDETKTKKQRKNSESSEKLKLGKKEVKELLSLYQQKVSEPVDFKARYCGHCNVATDIKEANFIGENFLAAGSDDGSFFIWDKLSTNVVRVLKGDESIVNCIQPHPFSCYIATSGIDPLVRLWSPKLYEQNENDERVVQDVKAAVLTNQLQMNSHPFEYLFLNLSQNANWEQNESNNQQSVACRPS